MITQQTNYSDIATGHKQNTTVDNRNISNVLSQIQDDGPAYANSHTDSHADLQRRDNLINLKSDKSCKTSGRQQSDMLSNNLNNDEKQPDLAAALMQTRMQNRDKEATATGLKKNKTTRTQSLLVLLVTLVITFFLFRIDARTNQLEVSLNSYSDDVLDSIDSYSSELSPGFRNIKKTLKAVKQELELIKANTVSETKSDNFPVSEQFQAPSINDNIGIMDDEILALKNELKIAQDKLKTINTNKARYKNPGADEKVTVTTAILTAGWVVNLASFTNKNKANKALEPLYAVGLSPLIQEVNVNGQRLYRLIIGGFSSQADARLFVRRADDEFGLQGGWIRKT